MHKAIAVVGKCRQCRTAVPFALPPNETVRDFEKHLTDTILECPGGGLPHAILNGTVGDSFEFCDPPQIEEREVPEDFDVLGKLRQEAEETGCRLFQLGAERTGLPPLRAAGKLDHVGFGDFQKADRSATYRRTDLPGGGRVYLEARTK